MRRALSVVLCVILIFGVVAPMSAFAADDYSLIYTYSDIQANKTSYDLRYGTNSNHIEWQWLPSYDGGRIVYLAQNEYEGFQVYFYERTAGGRLLDISVSPFLNADGEELSAEVYNEVYMNPEGFTSDKFAEALVPYAGEGVQTIQNENNVFYIELKSSEDQTPGDYTATVTLSDANGVVNTTKITARVWNFALPEGHLSTYLCGLYNSASGYDTTSGFLKLSGVRMENGKVIDEDRELAKEILSGWDDFLLEHGVNSYEIPAYFIDDDAKTAELFMADTRRSMFMIPVEGDYNSQSVAETITKYKNIVVGNSELEDKAFFYPWDEPNWSSDDDTADFDARINVIKSLWGDSYHAMVPFFGTDSTTLDYKLSKLKASTDIYCPNQDSAYRSETVRNAFLDTDWHKSLRYQGDTWNGNTYLWTYGKSAKGVFARALQWQAAALNSDGMLHWNCAFVPNDKNGNVYDVFENNSVPGKSYPSTGNGDGILVYSGASLGLDPATPIASLRLKQIASGMDDFDYLQLVKEFLGEDSYTTYLNKFLAKYNSDGINKIWNSHEGAFVDWECVTINNIRIAMGNALSAANIEHNYGEWKTVVASDDTHNGLEVRACEICGAKESRKTDVKGCDHEEYISVPAVPATCTSEGRTAEKKCSKCGEVTQESIPIARTAHRMVTVPAKAHTCTEDGYETYEKCSNCDYITNYKVIPAGHTSDGGVVTKEPTCEEKGERTYTCTACNEIIKTEEIAPTGHTSDGGVVTKEPTCEEKGERTYTCTACNEIIKTEEIAPTGHTSDGGVVTKEPTCEEDGEKTYTCTICHKVIKTEPIAKTGHKYETTTIPATCTESGSVTSVCEICGDTKTTVIPATNHANQYATDEIPATCTDAGYTAGIYCPDCNQYISGHELIEVTGHQDADDDGICDVCGSVIEPDTEECTCICHETGFMKLIWNFLKVFYKIFGINPVCACGEAHY